MRHSRSLGRLALTGLLVVALVGFGLQLVFDQPVAGAFGLVLLAVPGFAISRSIGPRPLGWPEALLVTIGAALAITVLLGTVAGLTPALVNARTVAILELPVIAALGIAWRDRLVRGEIRWAGPSRRIGKGSMLLAGLGVALAAGGLAIATRAAQDQAYGGFVQFWSLPATDGPGAIVGVRNLTGGSIDCLVTIDRPDRVGLTWQVGRLAPNQALSGLLPQADADETASWRLALECDAGTGQPIERQLSIEPPR